MGGIIPFIKEGSNISSTSIYSEHPCNFILKSSKMITIIESDLNNPWKGREGPQGLSTQQSGILKARLFPHFEPKKRFLKKVRPKIAFG